MEKRPKFPPQAWLRKQPEGKIHLVLLLLLLTLGRPKRPPQDQQTNQIAPPRELEGCCCCCSDSALFASSSSTAPCAAKTEPRGGRKGEGKCMAARKYSLPIAWIGQKKFRNLLFTTNMVQTHVETTVQELRNSEYGQHQANPKVKRSIRFGHVRHL